MKYYIIGGGIIGSTIALGIRLRDLGEVVVLEKENKLGEHASGRNSGVIHSGINQKPGTLKAKMCVKGSRMLREYCITHRVPMQECGTLVVARNEEEIKTLETLLEMGKANGVPELRIIGEGELEIREPNIKGVTALYSPNGAIVDAKALNESVAKEAQKLGVKYLKNCKVEKINGNKIITNEGEFLADHIVNCAGLYADKIAHMMNIGLDYSIIPFRGDYIEVDTKINSMIYQIPDLRYPFLGVHFTKTIEGKVLGGPNAALSWKGRESYDGEFSWKEIYEILTSRNFWNLIASKEFLKLAYKNAKISLSKKSFIDELNSFLENKITKNDVKPYRSGIRAQVVSQDGKMIDDFLIKTTAGSTHILNAVSPGLTCSLAFAEFVVDGYIEKLK